MKTGLAIWHYPHRTPIENAAYFSESGLDSVSMLGYQFLDVCRNEQQAEELAKVLEKRNPVLTVHHKLPLSHSEEHVASYMEDIRTAREWHGKYGKLAIYSFDVPQAIRDNIYPYLKAALDAFEGQETIIAIEDFGLTDEELRQLEPLKGNRQFGFLLDAGHLHIRLNGKYEGGATLFRYSKPECPDRNFDTAPAKEDFLYSLKNKPFPIVEMHLHNNDGQRDVHWFLEDGVMDIEMYAQVLKEVGFDGVLTIESAPGMAFKCAGQDADDGIARTIAYWKKCMEKA